MGEGGVKNNEKNADVLYGRTSLSLFFQIVAKFGMMHIIATNACIVIRTLVKESSKELMGHHDVRFLMLWTF